MDSAFVKLKQILYKVPILYQILYHFRSTRIGQYFFKVCYSFLTLRQQKIDLESTVNNLIRKEHEENERYLLVGDSGRKVIDKKYADYRKCAVCGTDSNTIDAFYNDQFSFMKCKQCGFIWMQPMFSDDNLLSIYSGKANSNFAAITNHVVRRFLNRPYPYEKRPPSPPSFYMQKVLRASKGMGVKRETLLDIGCQNGRFLLEAKHYFTSVEGVEINEKSAEYAAKSGLKVHNLPIEKVDIPEASFDVITMNQVIEHIKDPAATMRKAFGVLKGNGILFVATPNVDGISYRVFKGKHSLLRGFSHISMFNRCCLGRLANNVGFKVVDSGTYYLDIDLYDLFIFYFYRLFNRQDKFLHRYNVHLYGYCFLHALQFLLMPYIFDRFNEFRGRYTKEWGSYLWMTLSKPLEQIEGSVRDNT